MRDIEKKLEMKRSRSLNLDLLRSVALMIILINHLGRFFPSISWIIKYTYSMFGIVTSAEIFLAISAYSIYKSSIDKEGQYYPEQILIKKAVRRFVKLYTVHIVLLALVVLLSLGSNWQFAEQKISIDYPASNKFFYGMMFLFQPALFDILPLYLFFSVLNPFLIASVERGRFRYLFLLSTICWALVSLFGFFRYERFTDNFVLPFFHLLAWQFLYCCLILLFSRESFIKVHKNFFLIGSICLNALLFIYGHFHWGNNIEEYYLTSRQYMGPIRILNVLSLSVLILSIGLSWGESRFSNIVHWIGANALTIFSLHVIIFYINRFYIYNYAYYWSSYLQVITYLVLVILPFPLALVGKGIMNTANMQYGFWFHEHQ